MNLITLNSTVLALILVAPIPVIAAEPVSKTNETSNPIEAIVQVPVTGVRVALGAAAIPFLIVGEIGDVSGQVGEGLWEQASNNNSPANNNDK